MNNSRRKAKRPRISQIKATAYHEAGHAVVAYLKAIPLRKKVAADILSVDDRAGAVHFRQLLTKAECEQVEFGAPSSRIKHKLESRVICDLAGYQAQRRFNPRSVRSYHASSDYRGAVNLLSPLAGSNEEIEVYAKLLSLRAQGILKRPGAWKCVQAVALALLEKHKLSRDELVNVIRSTFQREVTKFNRAHQEVRRIAQRGRGSIGNEPAQHLT